MINRNKVQYSPFFFVFKEEAFKISCAVSPVAYSEILYTHIDN